MANKDTTMLPPFRVRRILPLETTVSTSNNLPIASPSSHMRATLGLASAQDSSKGIQYADGVILMNKDEYANLLKQQPQAALRYVDEDDGETIHVGSALELDQRLKEPVGGVKRSSRYPHGRPLPLPSILDIHAFDVERQQDVIKTWADIHGRNKMATGNADSTKREPILSFGETPPLAHNAPKKSTSNTADTTHAKRWAGYGSMPTAFDSKPWTATDHAKESAFPTSLLGQDASMPSKEPELSPEELHWQSYKTQKADHLKDMNAKVRATCSFIDPFETQKVELEQKISQVRESLERASSTHRGEVRTVAGEKDDPEFRQHDNSASSHDNQTPVLSSTLQVRTDPKQQKEYMPLLELFQAQLAQLRPDGVTQPRPSDEQSTANLQEEQTKPLASPLEPPAAVATALPPAVTLTAPLEGLVTNLLTSVASSMETSCRSLLADLRAPLVKTQQTVLNDVEKLVDRCVRMIEPTTQRANVIAKPTDVQVGTESKSLSPITTTAPMKDAASNVGVSKVLGIELDEADIQAFEAYQKALLRNNEMKSQRDSKAYKDYTSKLKAKCATRPEVAVQKAITDHWQPEDIMASRSIFYCVGGQEFHQYLVRWKDHGSQDDCWVDEQALQNYQHIIRSFNVQHATERAHRRGWGLHTNTSHLPTLSTFKDNVILEPRPQSVPTSSDDVPLQDKAVELTVPTCTNPMAAEPFSGNLSTCKDDAILEPRQQDVPTSSDNAFLQNKTEEPTVRTSVSPVTAEVPSAKRTNGLTCPICGELFFDPEKPGIMLKCKCAETSWSAGTSSKPRKTGLSNEQSLNGSMKLPDVPKAEPTTKPVSNDNAGFNFDQWLVGASEIHSKEQPTLWQLSGERTSQGYGAETIRNAAGGNVLPTLSESSRTLFEALISGNAESQTQHTPSGPSQPLISIDSTSDGAHAKNTSEAETQQSWKFAPSSKEILQNLDNPDNLNALRFNLDTSIETKPAGRPTRPESSTQSSRPEDFRAAAAARFLQWNKDHPIAAINPCTASGHTAAATPQNLADSLHHIPTLRTIRSSPLLPDYQMELAPITRGQIDLHRSTSVITPNRSHSSRVPTAGAAARLAYGPIPPTTAHGASAQNVTDGIPLDSIRWPKGVPPLPTKPALLMESTTQHNTAQTGMPIQQRLQNLAASMSIDNNTTDINTNSLSRHSHRIALNASPLNPTTPPLSPLSNIPESSSSAQRRRCIKQLLEMGFPRDKALLVADQAEGDMEKALDMLEEDAKIWNGRERGKARAGRGEVRGPVPGSWDDELYG